MKKLRIVTQLIAVLMMLSACKVESIDSDPIVIPECLDQFTMTLGEKIPWMDISIPYSEVKGDQENFINYCKPEEMNPLRLSKSQIRTHQIILTFDAIYPIESLKLIQDIEASKIETLSIETSLNKLTYQRVINQTPLNDHETIISMGGTMAQAIKLIFAHDDHTKVISHLEATLADGIIIKEDEAWSNTFLRYNGWTGADGIFTYNLTDGNPMIGAPKEDVGFIFSDTFIGEVYPHNKLRKSSVMINNSLGYMSTSLPFNEAFQFEWGIKDDKPDSIYHPDHYIGNRARNLTDGDGLSITQSKDATLNTSSEGISYLSQEIPSEIDIDLRTTHHLSELVIWNYNANPNYGTKRFELYTSINGIDFNLVSDYLMNQATGSNQETYTLSIDLNALPARYLKLKLIESYDETYVGLGKLMIFDEESRFLFGEATSSSYLSTLHQNELSARLWLQDGVVINNTFYNFPILVKDESTIFKVHNVGMTQTPIREGRLIYSETIYYNTPLQVKTDDGGTIFMGAGVMNHIEIDGYIYIYGYKDLAGRHLVVGRFLPEDILNFNNWTYFDGTSFTSDITKVVGLKTGVSAELSVTYMNSGLFAGKYMLVVMENTTSGRISYALSDTPYGPFGDYNLIYQTIEHTYLRSAFSYNAKMHPVLSEPGSYLISYNVNTTQAGALSDARIYYPRFIKMIEVKK